MAATVGKHKCNICGKEVTFNNSYIGSHIKRIHNMTLDEYYDIYNCAPVNDVFTLPVIYKNFTHNLDTFKVEKCGFVIEVFNASTSITEEELSNQIHNTEFIFSKLTPILENFLSTDNES